MRKKKLKPQLIAKTETQIKILNILTKERRLRWHELKEKTKLSSRTLSDRMRELLKMGVVRRVIDTSQYPPAVYYEATSKADLMRLPIGSVFNIIENMMEEWRLTRQAIGTLIRISDPSKVGEEVIRFTVEDYVIDLLFTLRYCLENPEYSPYLIYYHVGLYSARLEHLIETWRKYPQIIEAAKKLQTEIMEERKKEREKFLEEFLPYFKDKDLAKHIIELYAVTLALGEKKTIFEFLEELTRNEVLRSKLEKMLGQPIDEARLKSIKEEKAWQNVFSKTSLMPHG